MGVPVLLAISIWMRLHEVHRIAYAESMAGVWIAAN